MLPLVDASACQACVLRAGCSQVVCGSGSSRARLMLLGGQPDSEADLMDRVFAGPAGAYLDRLLSQAGIEPLSVYRTYAVKCAGKLTASALRSCKGWLWKELQQVGPAVVLTLGQVPTQLLLGKVAFSDHLGKLMAVRWMTTLVCPWLDPKSLFQAGKKRERETLELFVSLKETFQC